ncbi:MAG: hypothetical protein RSB08_01520, partial [Clostridia bacterium]
TVQRLPNDYQAASKIISQKRYITVDDYSDISLNISKMFQLILIKINHFGKINALYQKLIQRKVIQ